MLRRVRLTRRTELTTRTRLKPRSARSSRRAIVGWQRQETNAVHARVLCEVGYCREPGADAHHPFGRDAEPWCSSRLVQVLLCRAHHRKVTGGVGGLDTKLRDRLRETALLRVRLHLTEVLRERGLIEPIVWLDAESDAFPRRFAYLVSVAQACGIEPPHFGSENRRKS